MCDDRRVLVQVSLRQEEQVLLRRVARAEGIEPAVLAHEVLMEGLRRLLEADGAEPPRRTQLRRPILADECALNRRWAEWNRTLLKAQWQLDEAWWRTHR